MPQLVIAVALIFLLFLNLIITADGVTPSLVER